MSRHSGARKSRRRVAEQHGGGGDPLPCHPFESFDSPLGFLGSRSLQRRDQRGGVEPLSMVAIDSDEPARGPYAPRWRYPDFANSA